MHYIVKALRTTYHSERKVYPGLNDLINKLDKPGSSCNHAGTGSYISILLDIDDILHDINQPTRGVSNETET